MYELTCTSCNGSNFQNGQKRHEDGSYSNFTSECLCGGTAEEIWENCKFLLAQFIRCKTDGPFNPEHPFEEKCDGCAYEREEILNHIWHYGQNQVQALKKESEL